EIRHCAKRQNVSGKQSKKVMAKMKVDFLTNTPTSGTFEEFHFGESFNHSLWVDFDISENTHWLGCFSKSYENGLNEVLFDSEEKTCCVIAGGKAYLIDIERKSLIFETDEHPLIQSIVLSNNPNYYFLGNFYSIYVLNKNGLVKEIEPNFMVDGIYLESQDGTKIIGKVDSAENQYESQLKISVDIESLEFDQLYTEPKINFLKKIFRK